MARNIIIWLIFGAALFGLFNMFQQPSSTPQTNQVAYSDFVAEVEGSRLWKSLSMAAT
jgi:cell division protease FtsH